MIISRGCVVNSDQEESGLVLDQEGMLLVRKMG